MKLSNIFINILGLSAIALVVACNEKEHNEYMIQTITAVIERPVTRTALDGPDDDGIYKTVWSPDDAIAVYSDDETPREFKLASGANTNKAEFKGSASYSDVMLAVYPYSIVKERDGSEIIVDLPEIQEYEKGNIPQGAYPMFSSSENAQFTFKNLCSVLKFRMFGDLTIKSITLTPNDSDTKVSGEAFVDINSKELVVYKDANPSVRLNCPDGVKLTNEPTDFLIVVPAQKYSGGFTITISANEGIVVKTIKSDLTLNRSTLYPSEVFECKVGNGKDNIVFDDANFKTYMIKNFDTDSDGEISHEEAVSITKIKVDTEDIESLAGIEHLVNLTELTCEGPFVWPGDEPVEDPGKLKTLDVSKNANLTILKCGHNQLSTLDLTNNPKLVKLSCEANDLGSLDVSKNTELTDLSAYNNRLSSIDVSNNTKLEHLELTKNQLKSIDVSRNKSLRTIDFSINQVTEFNPSNNHELESIYCFENKLTSIDVTYNPKLEHLIITDNSIAEINLGNNPELTKFYADFNKISELELSNNAKLEQLDISDNNLASLTLNCCPEIISLYINKNRIRELDISNLTNLTYFNCQDNPLETLYVYEGQIGAIFDKTIPDATNIVVKGADNPEDWAGKAFWHKSLGLKFTATWCGFCPRMATSFSLAQKQLPDKIEVMNVHGYDSDYYYSGATPIIRHFSVNGYPTGIVDYRKKVSNTSSEVGCADIVSFVNETERNYPTTTGISFNSTVSGSELNLDIKLYVKEKGDYKVTAVLLENNVIGAQSNGGSNYVHDHITRLAISSITGDSFSTSDNNKTVSKKYTATIPSGCVKDNLTILVFVHKQYGTQTIIRTADYGDYYVDNAISAPVGTTQDLVFSDGTVYGGNEDTKDGGEITLK